MSPLTTSEHVFEEYLGQQGIPFARIPARSVPTPDYQLNVQPTPVIAEVKQFSRSKKLRVGGYCPVPFVRHKIKDSWKQLASYYDHACCVVLYNESSMTVFLQPELLLCAMFGEYMERREDDVYRFSGVAAMRPDQNTRISSVVALLPLRVHRQCVEAGRRMEALTNGFTRELTDQENLQIHRDTSPYEGQVETLMRAVVVDNPFAHRSLSPSIFTGPYDERWAQAEDGTVRLAFSGTKVAELRRIVPEYPLKIMGLW
jgi:hypothetical protein